MYSDKLFSQDIIDKIGETEFEGVVDPRQVQAIILKCAVGQRQPNGKVSIAGKKLNGYTNIPYAPFENCTDAEIDE